MSVISNHNAGFFSCCSVKLTNIVDFINLNNKKPDSVDSSQQFEWYKNKNETMSENNTDNCENVVTTDTIDKPDTTDKRVRRVKKINNRIKNIKSNKKIKDITYEYFEHYDNIEDDVLYPIKYHWNDQFLNYSLLDYSHISPLVKKYFSPSKIVNDIIYNMEKKYNLIYENICVLFYRGNDKITETALCQYDEYLQYADEIINKNPNILFLIQSDESEFIEFMTNKFPNNSFYFKDEIRHMKKCNDTVDLKMPDTCYDFSKKYLAITIIMSKCKYIICGSGNCSIWIMLYRNNNINVVQNLKKKWYNTLV